MKQSYFLIYRVRQNKRVNWDKPEGGLVMKPKRICDGLAVADLGLCEEVASHRYHCAPDETLMLVEVFDERDQRRAHYLHRKYERDMSDFLELMET